MDGNQLQGGGRGIYTCGKYIPKGVGGGRQRFPLRLVVDGGVVLQRPPHVTFLNVRGNSREIRTPGVIKTCNSISPWMREGL